jgi:hypothetical protein
MGLCMSTGNHREENTMHSNIHAVRVALGASAVLAAGLVLSACGSEQGVEPEPTSVVGQSETPTSHATCAYTADQMQRRIDAGRPAGCGSDDGHPGFAHANDAHHPL